MRDSHSLFDYESSNVKKTAIVVDSRATLVIDEDFDLHLNTNHDLMPYDELIHIEKVKPGKVSLIFIVTLDTFEIKAAARKAEISEPLMF